MGWEISKTFKFSAAHRLVNLDRAHPCMRQHGHNYTVTVTLTGQTLDQKTGMLVDYRILDLSIGKWIDDTLDHQDLCDIFPMQTTAENIAWAIYMKCQSMPGWGSHVSAVTVSETDKTSATYRG